MYHSHLSAPVAGRQCWTCRFWHGEYAGERTSGPWVAIVCHSHPPDVAVHAAPRTGCAFYSREPGSDDEPWWE